LCALLWWRHSQAISIHNCLLHVFVFLMMPFNLIEYHVPRRRCQWMWDVHSSSHCLQTWPTSCQMSIDIFQAVCVACRTTAASPQNLSIHECHIHMLHKTPWHLMSSISLYPVRIVSSLRDHHVLFMEYATLEVSFFSSLLLPAL
jgi:hypothetical protein